MSRRHYNLPPLTMLLVFEAAARHLSFKAAAQDLSVTPAAVSHQIKALEGELGTQLFMRKHRGVELTEHGVGLCQVLSSSFTQISRELEKIQRADEQDTVTVGSTTAVAALWLSPLIIDFWQLHTDVSVNQVTQDRPFQIPQGVDFFIQYGREKHDSLEYLEIYRDELVPVAAPDLARSLDGCSLQELAKQRLIHLNVRSQNWTTWPDWFGGLGYEGAIHEGTIVTNYSLALQFARKGAGVALGWKTLISPMLESGKLAVIGAHALPAPHPFCLVGPPKDQLSENGRKLQDWILERSFLGSS